MVAATAPSIGPPRTLGAACVTFAAALALSLLVRPQAIVGIAALALVLVPLERLVRRAHPSARGCEPTAVGSGQGCA